MAGGSGSRLWPMSRQILPKQFLTLFGDKTMLQSTVLRTGQLTNVEPIVICAEEHRFTVAEQLRSESLENGGIILEPEGKNTAPAVALASFYKLNDSCSKDDDLILVLAADHLIEDEDSFCRAVESSIPHALEGNLVTFGITPSKPETGYGYIKSGKRVSQNAFLVDKFVEKPNKKTAKHYLDEGSYYWNSGMFLFKASVYLDELKKHRPDIYYHCQKSMQHSQEDFDFLRVCKNSFSKCPSDSIDYAVMEHTDNAIVVPMDCGWNDVGGWEQLWEISEKDMNGNVVSNNAIVHNCLNSYIRTDGRLIAALGLDDCVIVDTPDATLVAKHSDVQSIKGIVDILKDADRDEWLKHRTECRPWGKVDVIDEGELYKVNRITVNAKAKLSTQLHHHRAEHWIVVSGIAKIKIADKAQFLTSNQSTYIPAGVVHSLENPGKIPLKIIEVQSGVYIEEDDIVRLGSSHGKN